MYKSASLLGVIPARGGSKGLPDKNILPCAGRPLIEWSVRAARESGFLDDVIVSTDSPEIAAVARQAGASVPFLRPAELATDESSMLAAVRHAWEHHTTASGARFDYVVLLQPTSPLRTARHITEAIELYFQKQASDLYTLASVSEVSPKFGWLMRKTGDGCITFCRDLKTDNPQRQKLEPYYLPNGAIFIVRGSTLDTGLYRETTIPFLMSEDDSLDIDARPDLELAEQRLLRRDAGLKRVPHEQYALPGHTVA